MLTPFWYGFKHTNGRNNLICGEGSSQRWWKMFDVFPHLAAIYSFQSTFLSTMWENGLFWENPKESHAVTFLSFFLCKIEICNARRFLVLVFCAAECCWALTGSWGGNDAQAGRQAGKIRHSGVFFIVIISTRGSSCHLFSALEVKDGRIFARLSWWQGCQIHLKMYQTGAFSWRGVGSMIIQNQNQRILKSL